jgi:hypothetical protein
MTSQHDTRMCATLELITGLNEVTQQSRGATALKRSVIGVDAVQAIYELSDTDRAALARLITTYQAIYDSYMSVRHVSDLFKVRPKVIKKLARSGALCGYKRRGKWVFSPRAVERFVTTHTMQAGVLMIDAAEWHIKRNSDA